MKIIFRGVLLALVLATIKVSAFAATAPEWQSRFSEANTKYQSGEFKKAISFYEDIAKTRPTAALYYNLGNASLKAGKKGKALLYYERALRATPRDADLLWNIKVLKDSLQDRLEEGSANLVVAWISKGAHFFTWNETATALTGSLLILLAGILLGFFFPWAKGLGRFVSVVSILSLVAFSVLFGFQWNELKYPKAVILEKEVIAYYGPSLRETKAFALHEGAEAQILDSSRDWVYVSLTNGTSGWISAASCQTV